MTVLFFLTLFMRVLNGRVMNGIQDVALICQPPMAQLRWSEGSESLCDQRCVASGELGWTDQGARVAARRGVPFNGDIL
jgi:hypothetical protein